MGGHIDNDLSASSKHVVRPGYEALVEAYAAGGYEALWCWDLDRLHPAAPPA